MRAGAWTAAARTVAAAAIATAAGALLAAGGFPVPWLVGSLLACATAAVTGFRFSIPDWLKTAIFVGLGVQIGTGVTPETLDRVVEWPITILVLLLTVAAVTVANGAYFHYAKGWDRPTAFLAANPGALSLNLALADVFRANMMPIVTVQSLRLVYLVTLLPVAAAALGGDAAVPDAAPRTDTEASGAVILLVAGFAAGWLAERLRVPAGYFLGAFAASAVLHLSGIVGGALPEDVMVPCTIGLGMIAGARFSGITLTALRRLVTTGTIGFAIAALVSVAGAAAAAALSGMPMAPLLLAFVPGGLEVMIIIAYALQLDPALVAMHHLARYLALSAALPFVAERLARHKEPGSRPQ